MSRHQSHINTTVAIIEKYDGSIPLEAYLKNFFCAEKKYGSKDRRQISKLCYNYFRLGYAAKDLTIEERIVTAYFLCEQQKDELLEYKRPEWNEFVELPL